MEDVLPGALAVGEQSVDPVAGQLRGTQRPLHPQRDAEHVGARVLVELVEAGCVTLRDHDQVTRVDRVEVHPTDDELAELAHGTTILAVHTARRVTTAAGPRWADQVASTWQRGQNVVPRPPTTVRASSVPQRSHGAPARP